jgi:GNAT superfamily N-acetyltransferase
MLIVPVTQERLPAAAGVMGRGFLDDPMMRWSLGGDLANRRELEERFTVYFHAVNPSNVEEGWMWEAEGGAGAAVWLPPDATASFPEDDLATRPAIAALTDDGGAHYGAFWDWLNSHIPDEPLWFLDQIAVEPSRQGEGIGSALIEHGLSMARAVGQGAYLETGNQLNVAYYERFGFRILLEGNAPDGGPHIWFMRSDP